MRRSHSIGTLLVRVKPPVTLIERSGGYGLHPQEHPIVDKGFRLDYFQSFDDGILDLVRIDHGFLGNTSSCTSSSIG